MRASTHTRNLLAQCPNVYSTFSTRISVTLVIRLGAIQINHQVVKLKFDSVRRTLTYSVVVASIWQQSLISIF